MYRFDADVCVFQGNPGSPGHKGEGGDPGPQVKHQTSDHNCVS